jgi:hypothetical protein
MSANNLLMSYSISEKYSLFESYSSKTVYVIGHILNSNRYKIYSILLSLLEQKENLWKKNMK